jgi:hypothetical protein
MGLSHGALTFVAKTRRLPCVSEDAMGLTHGAFTFVAKTRRLPCVSEDAMGLSHGDSRYCFRETRHQREPSMGQARGILRNSVPHLFLAATVSTPRDKPVAS